MSLKRIPSKEIQKYPLQKAQISWHKNLGNMHISSYIVSSQVCIKSLKAKCRLKKKAQHEANKLKLHGLEEEHSKSCVLSSLFVWTKKIVRFVYSEIFENFMSYLLLWRPPKSTYFHVHSYTHCLCINNFVCSFKDCLIQFFFQTTLFDPCSKWRGSCR